MFSNMIFIALFGFSIAFIIAFAYGLAYVFDMNPVLGRWVLLLAFIFPLSEISRFIGLLSWQEPLTNIASVACSFCFWVELIRYHFRKAQAGPALLKIGFTKQNAIAFGIGILCFGLLLGTLLKNPSFLSNDLFSWVLLLSISIYYLCVGFIRIQFSEKGVFTLRLIPWKNIEEYHWEGNNTRLSVQFAEKFPILYRAKLAIPRQHLADTQRIIAQKTRKEAANYEDIVNFEKY